MRASRSAPSSSAATMNSALASACGSAKTRRGHSPASSVPPHPVSARSGPGRRGPSARRWRRRDPRPRRGCRARAATCPPSARLGAKPLCPPSCRPAARHRRARLHHAARRCASADPHRVRRAPPATDRARSAAPRARSRAAGSQLPPFDQHVREARVRAHGGKSAAVRRNAARRVERRQQAQQIASLRERRRGRRIEPSQTSWHRRPSRRAQGRAARDRHAGFPAASAARATPAGPGPQAITSTGGEPARPAATLIGGRL